MKRDAEAVLKKLKTWDEEMIQRRSKAYDDVENFPNKFTANYLFLLNQTESDLPRVNQSTLDRLGTAERAVDHAEVQVRRADGQGYSRAEQETVGPRVRRDLEAVELQ